MFIDKRALPRRTFLRGIGIALGLPWLDAMAPAFTATATAAAGPLRRLGFVYVPHGVIMDQWTPRKEGTGFEFTPILKPLEPLRDSLVVVSNLARPEAGFETQHAGAAASWLAGTPPKRTEGPDFQVGVTIDQIVAKAIGQETTFPSLEVATEDFTGLIGACSPGYACAYVNSLNWQTPTTPLPMEINPRVVFERMFGRAGTRTQRLARMQKDRSILDFVSDDLSDLHAVLGPRDRARLDEYLDDVREIERRIERAEKQTGELTIPDAPIGVPDSFEDHVGLLFDLLAVAWQADLTRVFTFMMAREFSQRTYPQIGVAEPHHTISHHGNIPERIAEHAAVNAYHAGLFAKFLQRLRALPDGDGTVLDHSLLVYGSGMSNGNGHTPYPLPSLVAGGAAAGVKGNRHLVAPEHSPNANLMLSVADKFGLNLDRFGVSTGRLDSQSMVRPRSFVHWSAALLLCAAVPTDAATDVDARLIEAARLGQFAVVRTLLTEQRADPNAREVDGTTALHWAVRGDDRQSMSALIKAGADVNATNRYGVAPLALAATNGSADAIDTLLKSGADANSVSPEGETVLMTAARTGSRAAVKVLLDRGANVNAREQWFGETALMWAAAENHPDVAQLLIEAGAELDARSVPLEFAPFRFNLATMVNTVLPRGSLTPLMLAARQGSLASARVLVDRGAALNLTDPDNTSAMVMAIINGHYDVAALLAGRGADPKIADAAGMAAVYALVDMHTQPLMINRPTRQPSGQVENLILLKQLLAGGAHPDAVLRTPILARYHNIGDGQLGAGATPLMRAAKSRDVAAMRLLLEAGADPKRQSASGATALMFAATPPRAAAGAAAAGAALGAVTLCLDRGADVNAVNANGQTALHLAGAAGRSDAVVKLLLSRGASPDVRDKQGRAPFDPRP